MARRLMIDEGLVAQRFDGNIPVLRENRELLERLDGEVAKSRDLGRIVEEGRLMELYEQRLPESVVDAASLRQLLKQDGSLHQQLRLSKDDLFGSSVDQTPVELYPDHVHWGDMRLELEYHFEPGSPRDGATATLPAAGIKQLTPRQVPWLVPGFIEPYVEALIRSLPKSLRRQLVPAPDTARLVAGELREKQGDFLEAVAQVLSRIAGEPIRVDNFGLDKIPEHWKLNFRLVDEQGEAVAEGRDLIALQTRQGGSARQEPTLKDEQWTRDGLTTWDWGDLPTSLAVQHGDLSLSGFVGIVDQGQSVGLRIFDRPEVATAHSRLGLSRLAWLYCRKEVKGHVRWLPERDRWPIWGQGLVNPQTLDDQLGLLLCDIAFVTGRAECRSEAEWVACMARQGESLAQAAQELAKTLPDLFRRYHDVQLAVEQLHQAIDETALTDLHHQLMDLFEDPFLNRVPWPWLRQFPRYLAAIEHRLQKLPSGGPKDRQNRALVEPHESRWREQARLNQRLGIIDDQLDLYHWLIEEYRVSLWAQNLGTSCKVSPQRLEKQWELVRR
ncbi:MAG: DUF3418 domain-containing protein [Pirellulaceae bacterium]